MINSLNIYLKLHGHLVLCPTQVMKVKDAAVPHGTLLRRRGGSQGGSGWRSWGVLRDCVDNVWERICILNYDTTCTLPLWLSYKNISNRMGHRSRKLDCLSSLIDVKCWLSS